MNLTLGHSVLILLRQIPLLTARSPSEIDRHADFVYTKLNFNFVESLSLPYVGIPRC
jgi:hypothetical protein